MKRRSDVHHLHTLTDRCALVHLDIKALNEFLRDL